MSHSAHRQLALRFCAATIAAVVCLFCWVSILTFDVADWPSESVWPQNDVARNWCGPVGGWIAHALFYYLGLGAYPLLILATGYLVACANGWRMTDRVLRAVGVGLVTAVSCAAAAIFVEASDRYLISGPGGVLGVVTGPLLIERLDLPGTLLALGCLLVIGLLFAAYEAMIRLGRWLRGLPARTGPLLARTGRGALERAGAAVDAVTGQWSSPATRPATIAAGVGANPSVTEGTSLPEDDDAFEPRGSNEHTTQSEADEAGAEDPGHAGGAVPGDEFADDEQEQAGSRAATVNVLEYGETPEARGVRGAGEAPRERPDDGDYQLPHIALLDEPDPIDRESIEILCREKAYILEQTLNEFRLEVTVASIETGPVITVFELRLAPGIKVSQIASLTNDMARALKAPAVRVVAPLPGKNTIGIEVPNLDKEKVRIKDLMRKAARRSEGFNIPLFLGKDASGQPLVSDLTRMPHLLIAGTTGSGKSVCISSIIMSLLQTRAPDQVQMILIDPKVVELAMFKDIPHLMCPIVTEVSKAESILDWAATKMDERYALLAEAGVKDIVSYNRLGPETLRERMQIESEEELARVPIRMPYIVIIIDELADLMMTSAKEVEFFLCRLAQKSRAVGIHLIVSTQRPQANVVTGLIKSNLPSRIAFRVSSRLDSRIVLDQNGGEVLMGQGDLLFLPPGSSKLVRAQGTFISDNELRAVVKHCRSQRAPEYHPELIRMPKGGESGGERDELFDQAVDVIMETGRGSVSLLQRKLTIGYGRASRLIDQMYDGGIVGEYKGSQAREVVISKEDWQKLRAAREREEAAAEGADLFV